MRRTRFSLLIVATFALCIVSIASVRGAAALTDEEELVERAKLTVESLKTFSDAGEIRPYVKGARAIVVIPEFVKAGFILGGAHGSGVMLGRNLKTGAWRYPAFVTLSEGSIGLQIGAEASEIIMICLTEKGVNALLDDGVKIGASAGIAVLTIGAGRSAGTTTAVGADVVTFQRSKGLFGGLAVEGAVLNQHQAEDTAYHGKAFTPEELVKTDVVGNRHADGLREALANF